MATTPTLETWLWEHAVALDHAWRRIGRRELLEQYREAVNTPTIPNAQDYKGREGMPAFMWFLQQAQENLAPAVEAEQCLQQELLGFLKAGKLVGYGFETERRLDSKPVQLPAWAWRGSVRWSARKVIHESLTFVEVRVLSEAKRRELNAEWHGTYVPRAPGPKRGPKGTARQIEEAYEALKAAGRIDFAASIASHYPAIRTWLQAEYPGDGFKADTPTDETLRKTVSPLFKEDRGSQR